MRKLLKTNQEDTMEFQNVEKVIEDYQTTKVDCNTKQETAREQNINQEDGLTKFRDSS